MPVRSIFDSKGIEFQNASLGNESAFKLHRLASSENIVIGLEPFFRFAREDLSNGFPNHAAYAGLIRKCWVGFHVEKIQLLTNLISHFLDDTKAFINGLEQSSIALFRFHQRFLCLFAFGNVEGCPTNQCYIAIRPRNRELIDQRIMENAILLLQCLNDLYSLLIQQGQVIILFELSCNLRRKDIFIGLAVKFHKWSTERGLSRSIGIYITPLPVFNPRECGQMLHEL